MSSELPSSVSGENISALRDILTTSEAATYLSKSPSYLRNNYQRLGIRAYRVGKQLRFRHSELVQWLDGQVI